MALQITYSDKVSVVPNGTHINEVRDDDMNEIKTCVNDNADDLETAEADIATNVTAIANLNSGKISVDNVVSKSAAYTAVIYDFVQVTAASDITITLPTAAAKSSQQINVMKVDSGVGNVIVATTAAQTINGDSTKTITEQWANVTFISNGSNWLIK